MKQVVRKVAMPALVCVLLGFVTDVLAMDRSQAFEHWRQHDAGSAMQIDHDAWEAFLLNYLRTDENGVHRVAYGEVKNQDHRALADYLDRLSKVEITAYRRPEQMAYWINLYNALMVKLVLDHYPIASIRMLDRSDSDAKSGPWVRPLIVIEGVSLSLNDIENRILKPIFEDPRFLYAITCVAMSCPNLQPVPFHGTRIDRQLSDAAMDYVNDPRCIAIENDELHVSSFYRWNFQAFGGSEQAIIRHLMAYAEPELAMRLQGFERLHGDHFDWRLNDVAR
ncbi:MAG: DUF547 domain-containing protein [Geminicoccaceae bacterium]